MKVNKDGIFKNPVFTDKCVIVSDEQSKFIASTLDGVLNELDNKIKGNVEGISFADFEKGDGANYYETIKFTKPTYDFNSTFTCGMDVSVDLTQVKANHTFTQKAVLKIKGNVLEVGSTKAKTIKCTVRRNSNNEYIGDTTIGALVAGGISTFEIKTNNSITNIDVNTTNSLKLSLSVAFDATGSYSLEYYKPTFWLDDIEITEYIAGISFGTGATNTSTTTYTRTAIVRMDNVKTPLSEMKTEITYETDAKISDVYTAMESIGGGSGGGSGSVSKWFGKKICFMGDSLTDQGINGPTTGGKGYIQILKERKNFGVVSVDGRPASTLVASGNPGQFLYDNAFCVRYESSIPNDCDLVVVFGGINDWLHTIVATVGTLGSNDINSLYGALNVLYKGLIQKTIGKRLMVVTPLVEVRNNAYIHPNLNINYKEFVDIIIEMCEYYAIPVLDLARTSGIARQEPGVRDALIPDGIHPNEAGHTRIADMLGSFIETL